MKVQVLGPLTAEVDGRSIVPTATKPRQLLALFALRVHQVVPVPTLIDELWGCRPPPSALTTLQTYVLQLRRILGAALGGDKAQARNILTTRHGGYLLAVPPECVDVHDYDQLTAQGRAAADSADDAKAAERLGRALALWRGPALVDVRHGPVLDVEVTRLQESHLGTTELRVDADLRLGRHVHLVAELSELTARHPQHEGLHSQAMLALYRSGRRAAALALYHRLRATLVDDLGVEPSPQVQRLHQAMLAVDPRRDVLPGDGRGTTAHLRAS